MKRISRVMQRPLPMGILIGMAVSLCFIWLHNTGKLQFLELLVYDYYVVQRSGPAQTDSPPITLITVSEADIRRLGHWPMNDAAMARMLELLLENNPRVIGLDLYRDIPVPPGSRALENLFKTHQNIVAIKKTGDENSPGISAPFMVNDRNPVGCSDLLLDPGGIVRRALLFLVTVRIQMSPSP
jgi:adenylate cyclase